jgi:hypothetical protein
MTQDTSIFITFEKKIKNIRWAAQQGQLKPPPLDSELWGPLKLGFTRTGQKYHLKYLQFWLILLFALHVKSVTDPNSVVSSAEVMQRLLDDILHGIPKGTDRAYDMRHAMLYLAFPESYERIISTRDKERILDAYGQRVPEPLPSDIDQAILKVRQTLSKEYDRKHS